MTEEVEDFGEQPVEEPQNTTEVKVDAKIEDDDSGGEVNDESENNEAPTLKNFDLNVALGALANDNPQLTAKLERGAILLR